jgi:hypothetical protein
MHDANGLIELTSVPQHRLHYFLGCSRDSCLSCLVSIRVRPCRRSRSSRIRSRFHVNGLSDQRLVDRPLDGRIHHFAEE